MEFDEGLPGSPIRVSCILEREREIYRCPGSLARSPSFFDDPARFFASKCSLFFHG